MDLALVSYWEKIKDTIHTFDNIITKFEVEGMTVLVGIISVSGIVYQFSSIAAGLIVLCALAMNIAMYVHCSFYYNLLVRALNVAIVVEKELFGEEKANVLGLTNVLAQYSTMRAALFFRQTRGRSMTLISHIVIGFTCIILALFYFGLLMLPTAQLDPIP